MAHRDILRCRTARPLVGASDIAFALRPLGLGRVTPCPAASDVPKWRGWAPLKGGVRVRSYHNWSGFHQTWPGDTGACKITVVLRLRSDWPDRQPFRRRASRLLAGSTFPASSRPPVCAIADFPVEDPATASNRFRNRPARGPGLERPRRVARPFYGMIAFSSGETSSR